MISKPITNMDIPVTLKVLQVDQVQDTDVLCGSKDTSLGKHHGNALLRDLINQHLNEYERATTKQQKTRINRTMIDTMRQKHGTRFLRQKGKNIWVLIAEQAVRDKISHAFRFASIQRKKDEEYRKKLASSSTSATSTSTPSSVFPTTNALSSSTSSKTQEANQDCFDQRLEVLVNSQQRIMQSLFAQTSLSSTSSLPDDNDDEDEEAEDSLSIFCSDLIEF